MSGKPCNCGDCLPKNRADQNLDYVDVAEVAVICVRCGQPATRRAGVVMRARGRVVCDGCDGRKKK